MKLGVMYMFKVFQMKSIMLLIMMTVVGGTITQSLPIFDHAHTFKKSQNVHTKENDINDVTNDAKQEQPKDDPNDSSLLEENHSNDDSENHDNQINQQKTTRSKSEKSNPTNHINTKESTSSQTEKSNNISNQNTEIQTNTQLQEPNHTSDISRQEIASPQLENQSNTNTESENNQNTTVELEIPTIHYDRTTSIYENDNITLLRVEYYVNNKLTYYSVVEQFDATTKSYTEKIYQCNRETNIDPLIRTDIYANGNLVKSY